MGVVKGGRAGKASRRPVYTRALRAYLSHTKLRLAKRVQLASKHGIHLLVAHLLATRDLKKGESGVRQVAPLAG